MNYFQAINFGNKILKHNNFISNKLDSELLAQVLNSTREEILVNLNKKIKKENFKYYKNLIKRRIRREPIAHILKKKDFWKSKFYVDKNVLIPRPETELIVEEALKIFEFKNSKRLLDIGTGSGCVIISILKERPKANGKAIDICKKALKIAEYNAKIHHLENKINFVNIDIDKFTDSKYDLIVSNPPYIKSYDLKRLDSDVNLYEPHIALDAGIDGFREIKKLILKSKNLLKTNGKLIFEIGKGQDRFSNFFLKMNGFYINKISRDVNSIPRVVVSTKLL
ncbi:peptide chain release factor N(5)-glutamine methyltransferase [Candidatus Pelagibacter sp.]|nr:peptide chain release factor N(5)-glutamine methyltransferase [Candidatus Pelagibacter sp.]